MIKFRTPFKISVSGPSGCGKSTLCVDLLNNLDSMVDNKFHKIYWVLGDENAVPKNLNVPVEFIVGVPEVFENPDIERPILYILDDSMFEIDNKSVANLITRGSHHQNISVIFITQNIYHQGKYSRTMNLNFSHLLVFKNVRDTQQFGCLARQIDSSKSKDLVRVYKEITKEPHTYLLIDLTQSTHDLLRFRTDIFNPYYATVFCTLPSLINDDSVKNEVFGGGSAYSACFKEYQV